MKPVLKYNLSLLLLSVLLSSPLLAQQSFEKQLPAFSRVYVSDKIDVLLEEGEVSTAWLTYKKVKQEDIRLEVKGKTLRVYLAGCRRGCDKSKYSGARILLSLSYQQLEKLVVMGDQHVQHLGEIHQDSFVLKAYGDNDIQLDAVNVCRFKTSLFGDGELYVRRGTANEVVIRTFGDHQVNLEKLHTNSSKVHTFGDNVLNLQVDKELRLSIFGDASIRCGGNPWIYRWIMLGDVDFQSL